MGVVPAPSIFGGSQTWFVAVFMRRRSFALLCALFGSALLRLCSFALICALCVFLRPAALRTTASGNLRQIATSKRKRSRLRQAALATSCRMIGTDHVKIITIKLQLSKDLRAKQIASESEDWWKASACKPGLIMEGS